MKTLRTLLVITIAIIGFTATSFGQSTATGTATATMITPINIVKNGNGELNFGTLGASGTAGTVEVAPNGTRTPSLGIKAIGGGVTAASFTVSGDGSRTYSIVLPTAPYVLTNTTGTGHETMDVTGFVSDPDGTGTLSTGTQTLNVGATLNVKANQVAGTYTNSTPFEVKVNYE